MTHGKYPGPGFLNLRLASICLVGDFLRIVPENSPPFKGEYVLGTSAG